MFWTGIRTGVLIVSIMGSATVNSEPLRAPHGGQVKLTIQPGKIVEKNSEIIVVSSPILKVLIEDLTDERQFHILEKKKYNKFKMDERFLKKFESTSKGIHERKLKKIRRVNDTKQRNSLRNKENYNFSKEKIIWSLLSSRIKENSYKIKHLGKIISKIKYSQIITCPFKCRIDKILIKNGQWIPTGTVLMDVSRVKN